jgi:ABC-type bacteriocin/lantibiotic exporter with double-glycine peptidase domain
VTSTPPFIAQERPDSCALACLRMVLAHQGKQISETQLADAVQLQVGGVNPEELVRLMERYGLSAAEQQPNPRRACRTGEEGAFPHCFRLSRPA